MTREEAEKIIKERFKPVEDKPGYVWFSHFQMISIETLAKSLEKWCPKSLYNTPLAESEGKALEQEPKIGHWVERCTIFGGSFNCTTYKKNKYYFVED